MKKALLFLIVCLLFGNCKKYEDDDLWFHLRKPYERLTKYRWKVQAVRNIYPNAYPMSCLLENVQIGFRKTGTCGGGCSSQNGPIRPISSYQYKMEGTWQLIENDSKIRVVNDPSHYCDWTILQLDRKELKIVSDSVEFTCIANGHL